MQRDTVAVILYSGSYAHMCVSYPCSIEVTMLSMSVFQCLAGSTAASEAIDPSTTQLRDNKNTGLVSKDGHLNKNQIEISYQPLESRKATMYSLDNITSELLPLGWLGVHKDKLFKP
jgi:hypothetical protein